ncbi:hypothetical protein KDI_01520 [Dictyobacter arantiisoli]|uniref:Smf/DprA SLOG domain-containing protein n=2 Tax=Dictyobacter arantiisoli TaxID=2014874 RepID=A0A5A5T5J1_9CHLR|nr:hypothetical protein KDI_01520 [Dictyobacter arantiisoli]
MECNNVVTGLAQIVIVAESDTKGGTWDGANGALKQGREVYVRQPTTEQTLSSNQLLLNNGCTPLSWPTSNLEDLLAPIIHKSQIVQEKQQQASVKPDQLSLLAITNE